MIYLLSHDRPIHEVIAPTHKKLDVEFARGFEGMASEPIQLDDLAETHETLINAVVGQMPKTHQQLAVSFVEGQGDWASLGLSDAANLLAIKWWQKNLEKLSTEWRTELASLLQRRLREVSGYSPILGVDVELAQPPDGPESVSLAGTCSLLFARRCVFSE